MDGCVILKDDYGGKLYYMGSIKVFFMMISVRIAKRGHD